MWRLKNFTHQVTSLTLAQTASPLLCPCAGKCTGGVNARYFCNGTTRAKQHRHLEGDLNRHGDRAGRVPLSVALGAAGAAASVERNAHDWRWLVYANAFFLVFRCSGSHAYAGPALYQRPDQAARLTGSDIANHRDRKVVQARAGAAAYKPAPARATEEPKPVRRADSFRQHRPATADATARDIPRWKYIAQNPFATLLGIH
jgi:hypothetical protein